MSTKYMLAALLALAGSNTAHMILKTPPPMGDPDNSPLQSSGSNFPCKLSGNPSTFYNRTTMTTMAIGAPQTLSFLGSAVHGGGSCQLALTSDLQPSANTSWEVILSIESGCPSTNGDGPSTYQYAIPQGITPGEYTFAWTWISKESGQPEYYMNCAAVSVTTGSNSSTAPSSKRSPRYINRKSRTSCGRPYLSARQSPNFPQLFVANLQSINSCRTMPGTDPVYPDPGFIVQKPGKTPNFATVTGDCVPLDQTQISSNSTSSPSNASTAPVPSSARTSGAVVNNGQSSQLSSSSSAMVVAGTVSDAAPTGISTNPPTVTLPGAGTATSSSEGNSGSCSEEGQFYCDGQRYQQCASGSWSVMQALPGGTSCQTGLSMTLWPGTSAGALA